MSDWPNDTNGNQAILYDWTVAYLPMLKPEAEMIVPDLSPLTSKQIAEVLRKVAEHPNYQRQIISVPDEAGYRVILRRAANGNTITLDFIPTPDEPGPRKMPPGTSIGIIEEEPPE